MRDQLLVLIMIVATACSSARTGRSGEEPRSGPLIVQDDHRRLWVFEKVVIDTAGIPGPPEQIDIRIEPGPRMEDTAAVYEGDVPSAADIITPVWQVSFFNGETFFLFETPRGLYQAFSQRTYSSRRLLPARYRIEEIWRSGLNDLFRITAIGAEAILGEEREIVEVRQETGMREPIIWRWAVGLGLIYYEHPEHDVRIYHTPVTRTPEKIWEDRARITYRLIGIR